eukprot:gnl/MRDRNA2_/MRDRNA2_86218_c0_seq6.p1 gnl/MRDRNA2_/MRDRNA2_86218_c0~~gnl/MRDRNA2_/MRDRNA2_86218_c0_seq6.p1  ORF type:complete len:223 (-),score=20.97 gnl/MRDRNA2_/MRDRNA2_86218_c0_seq6:158-826(-)
MAAWLQNQIQISDDEAEIKPSRSKSRFAGGLDDPNVESVPDLKLPKPWVAYKSKKYGDAVFFFNEASGESTWDRPVAPSRNGTDRTQEAQGVERRRGRDRLLSRSRSPLPRTRAERSPLPRNRLERSPLPRDPYRRRRADAGQSRDADKYRERGYEGAGSGHQGSSNSSFGYGDTHRAQSMPSRAPPPPPPPPSPPPPHLRLHLHFLNCLLKLIVLFKFLAY